ncbi:MAG: hypothetical protein Ct9H90mP6_07820 [Gammaproteobacteria bacterium]|nr:MAG: hypothetical protein Ct9H90mP6_07820 [Gammaproteobacteria bacterium]
MGYTIYDKLWNEHLIRSYDDGDSLIYIDRHFLHEVTSPQAFRASKKNHSNHGELMQTLLLQITMFQLQGITNLALRALRTISQSSGC